MASGDYEKKELKCPPKNPCVVIRHLVDLIEHPISQNATERHLQLLNEFLNASHYAFWLQDIPFIIRLYESIVRKIEKIPQYKQPLECLLYFSAIPPMLTRNSDKLEFARDFQEYFSVLGYLILCLHDDNLKKLVLNAIRNLLQPKLPIGYCCAPVDYCKDAAEKSRLPEVLSQLLQVLSNKLYPWLLDLMFLLCEISPGVCEKMVAENAIEYLLQRLEPTWHEREPQIKPKNPSSKDNIPIMDDTCCILWKLLSVVDGEKNNVQNPSLFALWSLQYAFRWSNVCPGHRVNRNNLTALILKIMVTFPTMEFIESGLGEVLALSTAGFGYQSNLQFTEDELDFQFKKIIWACLHFFQQYESTEVLKQSDLVKAFTKCLFHEHTTAKDHTEEFCELTKIILRVIPKYLPCSIEKFIEVNGPLKIVKVIEGYLLKTYETEVLDCYIFCLCEMLLQKNANVVKILGENNTSDVILAVCGKILAVGKSLTKFYQKILSRGFTILQLLSPTNESITLCMDFLNRVIHPNENDPLIDVRVTVCALHLLWCVLASNSSYFDFVKKGGIYLLLDITALCASPAKVLSLGVLADTAQRAFAIPYFITWRKNGQRLLPMLMETFRNEQMTCQSIENGKNVWLVLCAGQKIAFRPECLSKEQLLESCRCKIHAILYALKVKFKESVEVADEYYKLFSEKLKPDDELTMLFAENYSSLKMCQTWIRVFKQLQSEGITPVEDDNEHLNEKIERIRQWKHYLQYKIGQIVQKESQQVFYSFLVTKIQRFFEDHFNELQTYTTLKEARLSDALDGLKELSYISNCTETMFQIRKKLRLQKEVEVVRSKNTNFHRTICEGLFTNVYNQSISIQSNVVFDKKDDQSPPSPVSLEDNQRLSDSVSEHDLSEYELQC
ncbi:uncharacterized protein LOC123013458 isoform X2 [Tribolium madens]|uniref:uncharacterized protein LOC123013458 isoform X2 n=1 Tax=Tribolium madens TaxID=41895 RepID=UPI001CF73FAE|nr:uncharacterized protein LOC123013458 isoform X2 [Tribolium madens]